MLEEIPIRIPPSTQMKIVLLGNTGVGKTSILNVLKGEGFNSKEAPTVGTQFSAHETPVYYETGEIQVKQTILDTAGQKNSRSIDTVPSRQITNAFIFVVDGTKPLPDPNSENGADILDQLRLAKSFYPTAKFYIAVNKYGENGPGLDDSFEGDPNPSLKEFVNRAGITLQNDDIFLCSARKKRNIKELFDKAATDFCREKFNLSPHQTLEVRDVIPEHGMPEDKLSPSPLKNFLYWIKAQWDKRPTHSKAWIVGNGSLILGAAALFTLAAFTVGSFLTFGILPSAFIGAAIITAGAVLAWNIGCKIYDNHKQWESENNDWIRTEDNMRPLPVHNPRREENTNITKPQPPVVSQINPPSSTPGEKPEGENQEPKPPSLNTEHSDTTSAKPLDI